MKKLFPLLFLALLLGIACIAQVKIGLPAGPPQISSVLDLSNTGDGTKGLALPRVATTASILAPVNGLLIYDISAGCLKVFENGAWTGCLSQPTSSTPGVTVNCGSSSINGFYSQGTLLTSANTVTIVIANNSFSAVTLIPTIGDIVLSGPGAEGIIVASATPTSASPGSGGGTTNLIYTLSGTPTTVGSFTATFTKLSLSCAKTGAVCLAISPVTVTNTTYPSPLISPIVAGNTISFTAAGGTNNTAITWAMTSSPSTGIFTNQSTGTGTTATAILAVGSAGTVTVVFTATNACGFIVTGTQTAAIGDLQVVCNLSNINGFFTQNTAVTTNTITIRMKNNGNTAKTFTPAIDDIVFSGPAAAGITVASVSQAASVPANGLGTLSFTYTLGGTPTAAGSFMATFTSGMLNSCVKTGTVCLAISPITVTNSTIPSPLVSPIVEGSTINFTAAGGTNNTAISWAMTSSPATGVFTNPSTGTGNTASALLAAGSSGTVTVVFTATNACGLIVTGTQTASVGDLQAVCDSSTINGIFTQNRAVTPNTITIRIKNNGTTAKTFTPAIGDILFTGTGAPGITVASVSAGVSILANGGISTFTYTLGGTPTTVGSFTATFTSGTLNTCAKTGTVCLDIAPITVSSTSSPATLPNPTVAGNTITFNATGGTPNSGISWTMVSSPATGVFSNTTTIGTGTSVIANLVAGAVGSVTVTFTSTNACGLIVTGTQTASVNDALRLALAAAGCSSCNAYDAAAADTWVNITAAEYAQIDNFMNVNIAASNENVMTRSPIGSWGGNMSFIPSGSYVSTLPANNYVVAFSCVSYDGNFSTGAFLKYSTSSNNGFSLNGPSLSIPTMGSGARRYNIMKKPSLVINATSPSYVAIYSGSGGSWIGHVTSIPSTSSFTSAGNSESITDSYSAVQMIQIKGTNTKKW